jgi:hypothetical protein
VFDSLLGPASRRNGTAAVIESTLGGMELALPLLLLYLMDRVAFHATHPKGGLRALARLSTLASLCLEHGRSP